jgi:hypothetical protein
MKHLIAVLFLAALVILLAMTFIGCGVPIHFSVMPPSSGCIVQGHPRPCHAEAATAIHRR